MPDPIPKKQMSLQEIVKAEYSKCASNPVYFMKHYVKIQHPIRGKILFNLFPFQEQTLDDFSNNKFNIVLKSRQMGISTLVAAFSLATMIFNKDKNILIISTKQEVAKEIVSKVRFANDNLPTWLQIKCIEDNRLSLKYANGSHIRATSSSGDAGRSMSNSLLVIDEAAFIPEIEEIWTSAWNTLSTGGNAIILSCVTKDTYIFTDHGIKQIQDFVPNNGEIGNYKINNYNILGFNNTRSGDLFKNNGVVDTIKINTKYGKIEGSKPHKLWAFKYNQNKFGWFTLEELSSNDYVSIQYGMNIWGNNDNIDNFIPSYSSKIKSPINFTKISKELAYLFGLYIAEGSAYKIIGKNNQLVGGNITITCGDKDITWVFDHLDIKYSTSDYMHYSISSKNLIELFECVGFDLSNKAHNKNIPSRLLEMSKENILYLLRGIFDGDGCSSGGDISLTSTSIKLIEQVRILLNNVGILSSLVYYSKEQMNSYKSVKNKFNNDIHRIEISGRNSLKYFNLIGFSIKRKQDNIKFLLSKKLKRATTYDIVPGSIDLVNLLYDNSGETTYSMKSKYGLFLNGIVNKSTKYKTKNISRDIVIQMYNRYKNTLSVEQIDYFDRIIADNLYWVKIDSITYDKKETYDFSLPENTLDFWCHSIIYNGFLGHQTPNGYGNWFHQMWSKAERKENSFKTISLPWNLHPERDIIWRESQTKELGVKQASQECFGGDVIVYTSQGPRQISDIKVGELVLTHTGEYKPVLHNMCQTSKVSEIKTSRNYIPKYVTNNHPFLMETGEWKPIVYINKNENVISFPKHVDIPTKINNIDLYELIVPKYYEKLLCDDNSKFYINDNRHRIIHNRYLTLDYDFGYILGLYLAEGSGNRLIKVFNFNYKTELNTWPVKIQTIINEKFGISNFSIRCLNNTGHISFCSEILSYVFDVFTTGKDCYSKCLSSVLYENLNFELVKGIVDGYFTGDGCLKFEYPKQANSASQRLIYDMSYLLNILSIHNISIRKSKSEGSGTIEGRLIKTNSQWMIKILMSQNKHINNVSDMSNSSDYLNNTLCVNLKLIDTESEVYNLEVEDCHSYVTEYGITHNCDCSFLSSGDTVIDLPTLEFYRKNIQTDPIECRGIDKALWIWQYPDYSQTYIVSADTARGDGGDYQACHVINIITLEQCAEYKGKISTKEFGNLLVALSTEYNNALLVIERENTGWAVIQQVIERDYPNLFYMTKDLKYVDPERQRTNTYQSDENKAVAGFTTSIKTRPIIIDNIIRYFGEKAIKIYSTRTLSEFETFIWKNLKAQAMQGYSDDLVISLGIGLWIRDTALKLRQEGIDLTRSALDHINRNKIDQTPFFKAKQAQTGQKTWQMNTGRAGYGQQSSEDLKWLL